MKDYKINKIALILLLILTFVFSIFLKFRQQEYTLYIDDSLNTSSRISIYGKNSKQIAEDCAEIIRRYDSMLSISDTDSEIYTFNHSTGTHTFSPEVFNLITDCEQLYIDTEGRFDITIGAVSQLWSNAILTSRLPDKSDILSTAVLTDYSSLIINGENHSITKTISGQQLNLGAVAKGYISDCIALHLSSAPADGALIDLGGNIYVSGRKNNNDSWKIGIQNPDEPSAVIGNLSLDEGFVITSGDYQRYFFDNGIRYHHIKKAKNGYPANSGLRSVTIISDNGFLGDALSTACFIVGLEKGIELVKKYNTNAIFVTKDNKVFYSQEIENSFTCTDNKLIYSVF